MPDVKRTSLLLNRDKLREAQRSLGTTGVTDTIHAALDEVSRKEERAQALQELFTGDYLDHEWADEYLERERRHNEELEPILADIRARRASAP